MGAAIQCRVCSEILTEDKEKEQIQMTGKEQLNIHSCYNSGVNNYTKGRI
jgi:hypothetical protein